MNNKRNNSQPPGIKARALVITPDPNIPISAQAKKVFINDLPNPRVLRNAYFEMLVGATGQPVIIKPDGSYCYGTRDPEFAAVSVFISLTKQIELYLKLGLRQPERILPVVVSDPFVRDNAYFDPLSYQIHIGLGSGVKHGGLNKQVAFDLGVTHHEFAHAAVALQTAGNDLSGKQATALNEAIGDVLGTLVMDYLSRIWYEKEIGQTFTACDLENDRRVIGTYALPPFGIRSLKNSKRLPDDLSGEPHADGLIIGGALADLLVEMVKMNEQCIERQIKLFTKMVLMSLALLPQQTVLFENVLTAMLNADQQICAGKYRSIIEQCFRRHGIVFDTISPVYSRQFAAYSNAVDWMDISIV